MSNPIANGIYQQIGKSTFFMLGAQHLTAHPDGLAFRVRGAPKGKANYIKITLNSSDLYDFTAKRIWGRNVSDVADYVDVFNDQIHELIRDTTGLETQMPRIRGINA